MSGLGPDQGQGSPNRGSHSDGVVVTGFATLGPFGLGNEALRAALKSGEPLHSGVDRSAGYHRRGSAERVAACSDLVLSPWLGDDEGRRMSDLSRFGTAAARMALHDAGLLDADLRGDEEGDGQALGKLHIDPERTAVAIATAFGPGGFTERLALQILQKGGKFASPFLFTDCVANAAAGQIAIATGARGPNTTICQREAGPLLAIGQAADDLRRGRADVCLAGAVDELKPLCHAILDRFQALARPRPHLHGSGGDARAHALAEELPRAFGRRRNGLLAGEGATILVLEREDKAMARSARILARVGPTVRAFSPEAGRTAPASGHFARRDARADELAELLQERLLAQPGASQATGIDTIVSGANGSVRGDALEASVLQRCVARGTLAADARVLAPKAVHGEFGGGTLGAAMLAFAGADFAVPRACNQTDPALDITLAAGPVEAQRVLCSAHAAGGVSAWTLLERP